ARLWIPNVHRIKNIIDARLRRTQPGPGYIHLPGDLGLEYIEEIAAEELVDGKWKKRRTRNETWDHLVYGEATLLRPGYAQSRVDMRWVWRGFSIVWPKAADEPEPAPVPAPIETKQENDPSPPAPAPRRRKAPVRRGKGWMGRLS
ncbi:terminase gpA endonuclease subunit, partial [Rhizorhabdus sp.]|uniref:terminase gpA endonuclease subunit n=1 Tax=Rhizorhabdus sp. TaxID=1968843 RepID=UPI00198CFD87